MTKEELYGMTLKQRSELFDNLLRSTNRQGVDKVIDYLKTTDFYICPASTKYHGNFDGGLLLHSLLVYASAEAIYNSLSMISPNIFNKISKENIIITSLLHDICKVGTYVKANKNVKVNGVWRTEETYEIQDNFPFGHGDKSVLMLSVCGLEMETSEMIAIRWHMSNWDLPYGQTQKTFIDARNKYPLLTLLITADDTSSLLIEDIAPSKLI